MKYEAGKLVPVPESEQKLEPGDPNAPFDAILIARRIRMSGTIPEVTVSFYRRVPKGFPWMPVSVQEIRESLNSDSRER
jgi:hypothetical protein